MCKLKINILYHFNTTNCKAYKSINNECLVEKNCTAKKCTI